MRCFLEALRYALAATVVAAAPLSAQPYPAKPVKIIVAFPPGAATDTTGRLIAPRLAAVLGQPVIVENKPGAAGVIGTEAALKAPPDGYTLTMISSAYTTAAAMSKLNFDPIRDITPIIQVSELPYIVVVSASLAAKNVQELVSLAKAKPGKLNFASAGLGSPSHLAAELFATRTGIKMNHVPYKGGSPAITDTIAGHTDIFFAPLAVALPHVRAGKLRAIAVASRERNAAGGTPEQFLAKIKKEIDLWREVAREAGVRPE